MPKTNQREVPEVKPLVTPADEALAREIFQLWYGCAPTTESTNRAAQLIAAHVAAQKQELTEWKERHQGIEDGLRLVINQLEGAAHSGWREIDGLDLHTNACAFRPDGTLFAGGVAYEGGGPKDKALIDTRNGKWFRPKDGLVFVLPPAPKGRTQTGEGE
jgi:hypothetical protein